MPRLRGVQQPTLTLTVRRELNQRPHEPAYSWLSNATNGKLGIKSRNGCLSTVQDPNANNLLQNDSDF